MLAFTLFLLAIAMSIGQAAVAERRRRCTHCRGAIQRGEEMVPDGADLWMHEECEPMPDACPRGGTHRMVDGRCQKCGEDEITPQRGTNQ
jgi:hypothetical protein